MYSLLINKTTTVRERIEECKYDVFVATETWHHKDDTILNHASVPAYSISEHSREIGRGGGVAIFYHRHYSCTPISLPSVTTFEYVCVCLRTGRNAFVVLAIYQPGSDRASSLFYEELTTIFEVIILQVCPVIIGGDFDIHIQDSEDPDAQRLLEILTTFALKQNVYSPTHRAYGTLDLVMTFTDDSETTDVAIDPPSVISLIMDVLLQNMDFL